MYRTVPFLPNPRSTRVKPALAAMRSTLVREQRHLTASSLGEK